MPYNIPPDSNNAATDAQCAVMPCGAPSTINNINLEKSDGGKPGFVTVTRHMCAGESIASGVFSNAIYGNVLGKTVKRDASADLSDYPHACGYFDFKREVIGDSAPASAQPSSSTLWKTYVHKQYSYSGSCSYYYEVDLPLGTCFFKNSRCWHPNATNIQNRVLDMGSTTQVQYLTNPSQPTRNRISSNLTSYLHTLKFEKETILIKGSGLTYNYSDPDVKITAMVRHPRMNREELRFFGIKIEDFDNIPVASSGQEVTINYTCSHAESGSVAVVFFKWDLSTIIQHTGRVSVNGKSRDNYQILEQIIEVDPNDPKTLQHSVSALANYNVMTWHNINGGNRGDTGGGGTVKVTIPNAPFWDDDTVMVVLLGNRLGGGDRDNSKYQTDITAANWSQAGGYNTSGLPWTSGQPANADGKACGCHFQMTVPEYIEPALGCSQTRDLDWNMYSTDANYRRPIVDGAATDQNWKVPSTGSHIMKIVPFDYYKKECTWRVSGQIKKNAEKSQNSVVYAYNCINSVGDPYINSTGFLSKESPEGIHYLDKCQSYSINISPNADISNTSRCCSTKLSGPFVLEKRPYGKVESIIKRDSLHDAPDLFNNYRPNLSFFSENFAYNLENRIDCECGTTDCARTKCYACPSSTKQEYLDCVDAPECATVQDCCSNPCTGCSSDYNSCIQQGTCEEAGCCTKCDDCVTTTLAEYAACVAGTGIFSSTGCNSRGCCSVSCDACMRELTHSACKTNTACNNKDCCKFECNSTNCGLVLRTILVELPDGTTGPGAPFYENRTLKDYTNCFMNKGDYVRTAYPKGLCKSNCCCINPCNKYIDGRTTSPVGGWNMVTCAADTNCANEGCVNFLSFMDNK